MEYNFVDYFLIGGLNTIKGAVTEFCFDEAVEEHESPLDRSYVPSTLAHYPKERANNPFAEEVLLLCLPKGVRFKTQKTVVTEPHFHTFVCIRADGTQIYGGVLCFYELVDDKQILDAMRIRHDTYLKQLSTASVGKSSEDCSDDLFSLRRQSRGTKSSGAHTLPRRGKVAQTTARYFYDSTKDQLYVTKCIALVTRLPVVSACESLLRAVLHSSSGAVGAQLPVESYVYWLLHELPLPHPGRSLKVSLLNQEVVFQCPSLNELPIFDYSIADVLTNLSIDSFVKIYTCILLERQVLFCSKDVFQLMLYAETFQTLLFPFRWQHVYVPILPFTRMLFLEAPLPFIMGVWYEEGFPDNIFQLNVCVVDIDNDRVEFPEEVPLLPDRAELVAHLTNVLEKSDTFTGASVRLKQKADSQLKTIKLPDKPCSRSFHTDAVDSSSSVDSRKEMQLKVLNESEHFARVSAIAKKAGVDISLDRLQKDLESSSAYQESVKCRDYFNRMRLNSVIREVFLERFLCSFSSYAQFIIGCSDRSRFVSGRHSLQNFDKVSFLSDQPQSHIPFLAAFLETQMFASFMDAKILSQWDTVDINLRLFDQRLKGMKRQVRTTSTHSVPITSLDEITKREVSMDYQVSPPHCLDNAFCLQSARVEKQPNDLFNFQLLNAELLENCQKEPSKGSPWRQRYKYFGYEGFVGGGKKSSDGQMISYLGPVQRNIIPVATDSAKVSCLSHKHWKVRKKLVREVQTKVKRLLLQKLGREADRLGHSKLNIQGVEESTLLAGLCDVIERIWSHGLVNRKGKSAFWYHLVEYQKRKVKATHGSNNRETVAWPSIPFISKAEMFSRVHSNHVRSSSAEATPRRHGGSSSKNRHSDLSDANLLQPLPCSISYDMHNVVKMTDIKTQNGYARAFIRLALERKLLHRHLKTIIDHHELIERMYKPYALLRHDEEKEQMLCHLLSLSTADFFCFTTIFNQAKIMYHVQLVFCGSGRFLFSLNQPSISIQLAGSLCRTGAIKVPKNLTSFNFEHQNLGVLSTLRIGQDLFSQTSSTALSAKWYLEHAIVCDLFTGRSYKFHCARWFGHDVDDGSLERLLIAESLSQNFNEPTVAKRSQSPSSPVRHRCDNPRKRIQLIQQQIGDAINRIVKYFYPAGVEASTSLTHLLCGEKGLVGCLNDAFLVGLRPSLTSHSSFGSHRFIYPWDVLETTFGFGVRDGCATDLLEQSSSKAFQDWFSNLQLGDKLTNRTDQIFVRKYCSDLVSRLNANIAAGKDEKFKRFILIALKHHLLASIISTLSCSQTVARMYGDVSFFRIHNNALFLTNLLQSLNEFEYDFDQALIGE